MAVEVLSPHLGGHVIRGDHRAGPRALSIARADLLILEAGAPNGAPSGYDLGHEPSILRLVA